MSSMPQKEATDLPRLNCRCTDEVVKEPAVQAQLRIRRRHLECDSFASIKNNLNVQQPGPHAVSRRLGQLHPPIPLGAQERFGLAELQSFLPNCCG